MPRVIVRRYWGWRRPARLAVGDVICCPEFRWGLRWNNDASGEVIVAWRDQSYPDYHERAGKGTLAHDASRGKALFLVVSVELVEASGPDDVCPGNHRLSREVHCVRLSADLEFSSGAERIRFSLDEPMSVARPDEERIDVLGCAELPISWEADN